MKAWYQRRGMRRGLMGAWLGLAVVVAVVSWPADKWVLLRGRLVNYQGVERLGYFGYAAFDVIDTLKGRWNRARLGSIDVTPYRAYLRKLAGARGAVREGRRRKHVVYVQMESVDGLMIGGRKDGQPTMPFLDQLAHENIFFTNAVDNTSSGRTTDGEFLVLTSQVPVPRTPVYVSEHLDKIPSMPRVMKANGYRAVSIHGYNGVFWHRAKAHAETMEFHSR